MSRDPFQQIAERYEACTESTKPVIRGEARRLAAALGLPPPRWAEFQRPPRQRPIGSRGGTHLPGISAREDRAIKAFIRCKPIETIARALGASIEQTNAWLDDPKPQQFPDLDVQAAPQAAE